MTVLRKLRRYKTDPQREPLYQAERSFSSKPYFRAQLTRAQALRLIKRVRRQYALVPVTLKIMPRSTTTIDHGRTDFLYHDNGEIYKVSINVNMNKFALNPFLLLHELAHVVCDQYYGHKLDDHCKELVGILVWLYDYYRLIPEDAFRMVLRRYKVRHISFAESSPAAIRGMKKLWDLCCDVRNSRKV